MEGAANGKTFKMKGHTLPGISQAKSSNKSSTFQQVDPMMNPAMAAQPVQQVPMQSPLSLINISFQGSTGKTKTKTTDKSRRKWKNTGNTGCPDPNDTSNPNCP